MEKLFNSISVLGGTAGGFLVALLGGWDKLLIALITLMVLDYFTGVLKAIYNKDLSSKIGLKGIIKKIALLMVVAIACVIHNVTDVGVIRDIVIMFFLCNEGISVLENVAQMDLPIPEKLKDILLQLRDKSNKDEDKTESDNNINNKEGE